MTAASSDAALRCDQAIGNLRADYLRALSLQTRDMLSAWALATGQRRRLRETVRGLRHLAGRTAGGADRFGLAMIAEMAGLLETQAGSLLDAEEPLSDKQAERLGATLCRLRQAVLREETAAERAPEACHHAPLILVADAHDAARARVAGHLRRHGFRTSEASTCLESLEQALRRRPDLILMDIRMPMAGGFEFQRLMRLNPDLRDVPLVLLSSIARISVEDLHTAIELGVQGCVPKYAQAERIVEEIRNCLRAAA